MTADQLKAEALRWDHNELLRLWAMLQQKVSLPGWPRGKLFEYLVARAFDLEASDDTRWPYSVNMQNVSLYDRRMGLTEQLDGLVYVDHIPFLVECKDMEEPAAIEAVAKLRFRLESRPPGTMGVLFSMSNFSPATELYTQFASPLNVLLWNKADFDHSLTQKSMVPSLRLKYRQAVERGISLFSLEA